MIKIIPTAILFAICFGTIVYCNPTSDFNSDVGLVKCFDGPKVWCKNFLTAAECNAVNHCIQTVWLNKNNEVSEVDNCSSCIQRVNAIRNSINSKITKEVISQMLDTICDSMMLPKFFRKECKFAINTYVDNYLNDLLNLLQSSVDSETACHLLGFCWSESSVLREHSDSHLVSDLLDDDAVVYYQNIVLHFPAHNIQLVDTGSKIVGANRCTWGPSYWCNNLTTSAECKSTTHCISRIWSKRHYSEDSDLVCQVCKDMVKQARDQLQSNETQEELIEVLEGSCKLIPIKEIQEKCIQLADEFIPELVEILASEMNPTAVCTVAGLCNSWQIDEMLGKKSNLKSTSVMDSCVNCTVAFTAVEKFLKVSPKKDVLNKFLIICGELSSYSDACTSAVVSNFNELYLMMTNQLNPFTGCHLSGMCVYKYHIHPQPDVNDFEQKVNTMLKVLNDDLSCDLCKQLVHHFKEVLISNTTEEEFLEILKGVCQQTGKFEKDCLQIVTDNFRVIYKFLTEELDPTEICTEIKLCLRKQHVITDDKVDLISGRIFPMLSSNSKFTNLMPVVQRTQIGNIECNLCKLFIHLIQEELKNPEYENDIKKAVRDVCLLVPSSDKQKCEEFINVYAVTLIKMLSDGTDAGAICSLLNMCISRPPVKRDSLCPLCQDILHFIQEALHDQKDVNEIEKVVEEVCNIVPDSMKSKCDQFISEYSALIISILSEEIDPSLVCPALKICPSVHSREERCKHCMISMNNMINRLHNNYEEGHIKKVIDDFVPPHYSKAVAVELKVSNYENIVDMMVAEFKADESCVYLDYCLPEDVEEQRNVIDSETNEVSNSVSLQTENIDKPSCEICQLFIKIYEKKLTSATTQREIENMLNKLCNKISKSDLKNDCVKLVDKYVPVLGKLLKDDVNPKELCTVANYCSVSRSDSYQSECNVCEAIIGAIEGFLGDPRKKSNAVDEIMTICEVFVDERMHNICENLLEQIAPQFLGIGVGIPSWFYCTKLNVCPYRDLVDYEACSKPTMWCQDVKTAFLCDKLDYCQRKMWKSVKTSLN